MDSKVYEVTIKNKDGELIQVEFPMDEGLYKAIKTLSPKKQIKYFTDEYHDFHRQRAAKRRHGEVSIDDENPDSETAYQVPDPALNPAEYCLKKEQDELLRTAISHLNSRQRKIITSIFFEGKTQIELAEELGMTDTAMSHYVEYALAKLRKELEGKI
jgi:RNA polymerase sigma factor (sigma-70 family)